MFLSCENLTEIPQLNTSNGTNFTEMFQECYNLITMPSLDTSNGINFERMFSSCHQLTEIPQLNTSNGTNFYGMFGWCESLITIPELDLTNASDCGDMFASCESLINLGGFKGLKVDLDLSYCEKLTHESLMNVINNLAESNATLILGSTNLAKLTADEIAIATSKGWTLE